MAKASSSPNKNTLRKSKSNSIRQRVAARNSTKKNPSSPIKKIKSKKLSSSSSNAKKKKTIVKKPRGPTELQKQRNLLKKQHAIEKKKKLLEAKKEREEKERQRKLVKMVHNRERIAEMRKRKRAKAEEAKKRRAAQVQARKEAERVRQLAAQEKKKTLQEALKMKKQAEIEQEREQRRIFRIAEKAVKKGELAFDSGSLMISAATELSFASNLNNHNNEQENDDDADMLPANAVDNNDKINDKVCNSSSSLSFVAENSLLKLAPVQLAKLGIDKKALARSVSSAVAAKNRGPQERCCVCEDAWRPSNLTRKSNVADNYTSATREEKSDEDDHRVDDDEAINVATTTSSSSQSHRHYQLSFMCKSCNRPVHKNCLHASLIKNWNVENEIEDALKNVSNNKKTNVAEKVVIHVECVVCRSGTMKNEIFSKAENSHSSSEQEDDDDEEDEADGDFEDEKVPLTQQEKSISPTNSPLLQQDTVPPKKKNKTNAILPFFKGTHKYDHFAAAQRQIKAAKLSSSASTASILRKNHLTNSRKTSNLLDSFADLLSGYLLRDGFVVIPVRALYGEALIDSFVASQTFRCLDLLSGFLRAYEIMLNNEGSVPSLAGGFSNFRERGTGRYEMIHPEKLEKPVTEFVENTISAVQNNNNNNQNQDAAETSPSMNYNLILQVLKRCFKNNGEDMTKISSGCFIAEPGAAKQVWHSDGPSLALPHHMDLLPYALNVFIPLVNVDATNGTCFLPGSHLDRNISGPESLVSSSSSSSSAPSYSSNFVAPKIAAGDVLIFDYRVWHRGLGNSGSVIRPVVYATYSPKWFVDSQNFSQIRYKKKLEPIF